MRARSSAWARRADRPPAYRRGANYRTYKPSAISRGAQAKPGPRAMHIQRTPGPGARGPNDATTISETNPLMINKGIRQPRWTRERLADTTCPLNIHESPARMRGGSERDIGRGELGKRAYCDSIDLSIAHSGYQSR